MSEVVFHASGVASTAQDRWFTTDASSDTGYLPPSLVGHPNGEGPRRSHGFFSVHCVAAHVLPPRSPKRVRVRFVQALSSACVSWRCEGAIRVRAQTWTNEQVAHARASVHENSHGHLFEVKLCRAGRARLCSCFLFGREWPMNGEQAGENDFPVCIRISRIMGW
mgnify:CR=1 FL=1